MPLKEPRLMRLALKYSYIWKTRCTALRAKTCGNSDSDRCSVRCVVIRASDGGLHILRREQLQRLKVDSEPYGKGRIRARIRHLPAQLPPDLFFVPMDISLHSGTDASDFASLLFTGPTRVYLLLPTLMREPRWLRDLFVRVRDPASGNPLGLTASWHFGSGVALLLASGMKYQAFVRQRLMVWESVQVYGADEELVLGGPGHAEMGDTVFVIAARSLSPDPKPTPAVPTAGGTGPTPRPSTDTFLLHPPQQLWQQQHHQHQQPQPQQQLARYPNGLNGRNGSRLAIVTSGGSSVSEALPSYTSPPAAAAASTPRRLDSPRAVDAFGSPYTAADAASAAVHTVMSGVVQPDPQRRPTHVSFCYPTDGPGAPTESGGGGGGGASAGGGSAVPLSGSTWLLQRFIKAAKRDRVQDLRSLLNSDAWQRYCMSPLDVSFLPPGERHPLVVDLAVSNRSLPLLVELVDRAGCHLDYRSLKFLVGSWDRLPEHCAGGGEGLLLRYLVRQPNPLSVAGACLLAMRAELAAEGRHHSAALQHAVPRFQAVQMALLEQLQDSYFRTSEAARREAGLPLLEDILEQPQVILAGNSGAGGGGGGSGGGGGGGSSPPTPPVVLSDYSPLRLAFRDHDNLFMSAPLIKAYTQRRWLGPEYSALTCLDGHHRLSGLDSLLVYTLVENLGFVGDSATGSMQATFRLWHMLTLTSPAFFRSPRGRWAMKLMSTIAYLTLYMIVLMWYDDVLLPDSQGGRSWRALQTAFLVFTLGNLLEGVEVMTMRYHNSAGRYFLAAPGEVLGILVDAGTFACVAPSVLVAYLDVAHFCVGKQNNGGGGGGGGGNGGGGHPSCMSTKQWMDLRLALATLGIFVYLRSLVVLVPLYRKLGPLIRTLKRMASEILAFVPLYVSVTLGFAAALKATIGDDVPAYHPFLGAVLQLFEATLGTFNYDEFADLEENRRLYAYLLFSIYLILSALLLMNLLIAIISYKYRPEEVRADSAFDQAELVDRYRFQVQHHLICSPFNLLLLAFAWLPTAELPKLPPYEWVKYGLTPLDGLTFATPLHLTTPGGRHELPHLCYLLTLYPLIIIAANVLYYLHAPYTVLYWAFTGHRKLLRELLGGDGGGGAATADGGGAAAAAAAKPPGSAQSEVMTRPSGVLSRPGKQDFVGSNSGFGACANAVSCGPRMTVPPPPQTTTPPMQKPTTQQKLAPLQPGALVLGTYEDAVAADGQVQGRRAAEVAPPPAGAGGAGAASLRSACGSRKCGGGGGGWISVRFAAPGGDGDGSVSDLNDGGGGGGSGPVTEALRRPTFSGGGDGCSASGCDGGGGSKRESLEQPASQSSSAYRTSTTGAGSGGSGGGPAGLRAKSLRFMHIYANSQETATGSSNRNLSARLEESSLYEDMYDGAVEPPYMSLLRLATLRGAFDAVLSAGRFVVLVVAGAVLYVIVMGLLAGTLGCCLVVWTGSVAVSISRIVIGGWRGARGGDADGDDDGENGGGGCSRGSGAAGATKQAGKRNGGEEGGGGGGGGKEASSPSTRLISVSRLARSRANRSTYLTRDQVVTAVQKIYTTADVLTTGAAGGGGAAGGWDTVANRICRNPALSAASAFARPSSELRIVLRNQDRDARVGVTAATPRDAAPPAALAREAGVDATVVSRCVEVPLAEAVPVAWQWPAGATPAIRRLDQGWATAAAAAAAAATAQSTTAEARSASPRAVSSRPLSPAALVDAAQDVYDEGPADAGTSVPELGGDGGGGGEVKVPLVPEPRVLPPPRSAASGKGVAAAAAAAAMAPAAGVRQMMPDLNDGVIAIARFYNSPQDVRRSSEAAADAIIFDGGGGGGGRDTPTNSRRRLDAAGGDWPPVGGGAADGNAAMASDMYGRVSVKIPGAIGSSSGPPAAAAPPPPSSGSTSEQLSDALAQLAELTVIVRQLTGQLTEKPLGGSGGGA
ncbi:hypothetical protein PLESTB_001117600 [Pleodorina starrii]|uniref:Polycystin cation channel PKD1/PKD2 domain-containing protein n=1 Tax=Pleodorina starrii TaxID=330485 RepID=A0A9W6F4T5_9CHLO|nr:hypothetical protein PLESTB_001117600 [Pleodorina starrii]